MSVQIDGYKTYTVVLRNGFVCTVFDRVTTINEHAIRFYSDGKVAVLSNGLSTGNDRDYDIVQMLKEPLPALPAGYNWAGGWPTLRVIKDREYYLTNYPENYGTYYGADIHQENDLRGHRRIALEKIGALPADPPKENPEEYVIQNVVPCRPSDMCWYTNTIYPSVQMNRLWKADSKSAHDAFCPVGKMHGETVQSSYTKNTINVFCKRKDLPVVTPQYPIYYKLKNDTVGSKFVVRTSKDVCFILRNDGTRPQFSWNAGDDRSIEDGNYILASKEEFDAVLKSLAPPPMYNISPTQPVKLKADITFDMHDFTNFKREVTPPKSKSRAAIDYLVVEPSVNMVRVALSSLRYVLLVSVLSTIGYCVTHPSEFKKVLPKINFKIEKPEILE